MPSQPLSTDNGGSSSPSRLSLALAHFSAGRGLEAEQLCRRILAEDPREASALHLIGLVHQQMGRPERAVDLIRSAIDIDGSRADYHYNLGLVLESLGEDDDAIACHERAVDLDPQSFGAWFSLGNAYRTTSRFDRALECYRRALQIRPQSWQVLSNLGAALEAVDDRAAAIDHYCRALEIQPDSAEVRSNYGKALSRAGRLSEAVVELKRAIELDPALANAHSNLAAALLEASRPREALEALDACLAVDPGNRSALALRIYALDSVGDDMEAAKLLDYPRLLRAHEWTEAPGFGNIAEFDAALAAHVEAHPTLTYEPPSKSTRRGSQTGELLKEPKGPVAVLEEMIREAVEAYLAAVPADTEHPFLAHAPKQWRLNVWATLLDAQGHQSPHIHPAGWLSGVYYVTLPVSMDTEQEHAGWIEFGRAPERLDNGSEQLLKLVRPREGLMLLFPSYFYHRTIPFAQDERRISIAFDVLPAIARTDPRETPLAQAERRMTSGGRGAEEAARRVLAAEPGNARALHVLAQKAFREGSVPLAAAYLRRAIEASPELARLYLDLVNCLRILQRHEEAAAVLQRGFEVGADDAFAWHTLGGIMADLGRVPEAERAFRVAIEKQPSFGYPWYGLAQLGVIAAGDDDSNALQTLLDDGNLPSQDRMHMHFALGRIVETAGQYDRAFEHYRHGNEIMRKLRSFDAAAEQENVRRIAAAFTDELFAVAGPGHSSALPVFVVGMPRSGTTLVEQILASHPQVHGAGETNYLWRTVSGIGRYLPPGSRLPEAIGDVRPDAWPQLAEAYLGRLRAHAPQAARIVDKLPFNYTMLGFVRLMFPHARIIHVVRDRLDTCLSCYTTSFSNDRGFTSSLRDLGLTWRAYDDIMRHWRQTLPGKLIDVRYESLIDDTATEARRMIDHLGLEWSDACLDFHDNVRAVGTASNTQVRRKVYCDSIGRWRRFAQHLGPLREALGDHAAEERP